ncbi:endosome-associated-trafficking regulator 1 isoform X1 [Electrophorus electricus]|uniref:endosome-associated-trafficking regulator 1 isoform X1 n=1 Tax=Electrophorus electricus TaxID=8005 RepID=UPI0015D06B09|nr:endosome-associated-trafficking regulator 1 isoform X1 [Electrophorus electricus]
MSKHKTTKKTLIIEDDELNDGEDGLNPFSFREFIRSKTQVSSTADGLEKTFDGASQGEDKYNYPRGFDHSHKGHFFTDPSVLGHSFGSESEYEWTEIYQPSTIEEAHDLGLCGSLEGRNVLPHSLLYNEDKDETANKWDVGEGFSPETQFSRKSTGSYEGDEETSVIDVSFHTKKSSAENGIRDQQKLREENAHLRKHIKVLSKKSEMDSMMIRQLTDELHNRKIQEEREAKALETMVQSVEQNLQLMTKRAVKAENSLSKLKQEIQQLQNQLEAYKSENEQLRAGETAALTTMRHNAQVASEYLNKTAKDAETSIKQLLTGRETLCLVSQLLSSVDKITEFQK